MLYSLLNIISIALFRGAHVDLSPLVLAHLIELLRPVFVHLHHEALGPLRLEDAQDIHHGKLVWLLAQVNVGTLAPGVTRVLSPGIVIRLPAIKLLPAEVASHQVWLILPAAAVEACLRHLLGGAGAVLLEGPVLEGLQPGVNIQHDAVIGLSFLHSDCL